MIQLQSFFLEILLIYSPGSYLCSPLDICASQQKAKFPIMSCLRYKVLNSFLITNYVVTQAFKMFMKKCCEFLLFVHQTPNPLHFCGCTSNLNFSNFVLVSIIFYFKVVKNSAKMMMGKLQRLWSLSLVWLLTPLLLDSASEVMLSMAQEQFFSKTDNCRNIRYGGDPALVHPSVEGLQKPQVFPC